MWIHRARERGVELLATPLEWLVLPRERSGEPTPADCIVVPGARVRADGSASALLAARVANAVAMFRRGLSGEILFSGGARGGRPAEATVAHALARAAGVPAAHLHLELLARNTVENFRHCRTLMAERGWRSCLISTDVTHVKRCLLIARALGLDARPAPAWESPGYTDPRCRRRLMVRECVGLLGFAYERVRGTLG